jgi:hypothetical protein
MGFDPAQLALVTDQVRNLSIQDLEDLASSFFGQPVSNPKIPQIRAVDLKGLEDLFVDKRAKALLSIAGTAGPGGVVTGPGGPGGPAPGGTTCTPCCCCTAAVELDPFSE